MPKQAEGGTEGYICRNTPRKRLRTKRMNLNRYLFHWVVNLGCQLYVIRIEIKIESIRGISAA